MCPSDDPVDQPDFDPVEYLNKQLPDEQSLSRLPVLLAEHQRNLSHTEEELVEAVRAQATSAHTAARDLHNARQAVVGLHQRVSDIKSKAEESERTVTDICRSIRQLDTAKRNLGDSIRTLRNLQLLMMQIQNLRTAFKDKNYTKMNDALRSAQMYSSKFEQWANVPKVKELRDKLQATSSEIEFYIHNHVVTDIARARDTDGAEGISEEDLYNACMVIDAIGTASRDKMRQKIIQRELEAYHTMFRRGTEDARLERTKQRYAFIRRLLETNEHLFQNVLPKSWCVAQELCVEFCLATHGDLSHQLRVESGNIEVAVLVYVLQRTIEIEKELSLRMRWTDEQDRKELPEYKYYGMITRCFDDHMGLYVVHEDNTMESTITKQVGEEDWQDSNKGPRVGATLTSSEDLFMFIKESLKRVAVLGQPQTMAQMVVVWRKHLVSYTQLLSNTMPNPPTSPEQARRVCLIVNTADQCLTTCQALADEVQSKLQDADEALQQSANFDDVTDAYSGLLSSGILALVVGIERQLAGPMQEFSSGAFLHSKHAEVEGGESSYVLSIQNTIQDQIVNAALILPNQLLRFLLEKFASTFIPRYTSVLYRLKRLNDFSVNQIRIDLKMMESVFLQLPNAGNRERFEPTMLTRYLKLVRREFAHMAASLKVLQCETDLHLVDMYVQLVDSEHRSIADFCRLVEVKGLKREEMRPWITALKKASVPETTKHDAAREAMIGNTAGGNASSPTTSHPTAAEAEGGEAMRSLKDKFEKLSAASDFITKLKQKAAHARDFRKEES